MSYPHDYSRIDIRLLQSLVRWVQVGIRPGGFLQAVIHNDLRTAVGLAGSDDVLAALPQLVSWLYNRAPDGCWGSPDIASRWKGLPADEFTYWRAHALEGTNFDAH